MRREIVLGFLFLSVFCDAAAFEVNGFASGMTKDAARQRANETLTNVSWSKGNYSGMTKFGDLDGLSFKFCDDQLVFVSKGLTSLPNTIANLSLLVDERNQKYGPPSKVATKSFVRPQMVGGGIGRTLDFYWVRDRETFGLSVSAAVTPQSGRDGLFVETFNVGNKCGITE